MTKRSFKRLSTLLLAIMMVASMALLAACPNVDEDKIVLPGDVTGTGHVEGGVPTHRHVTANAEDKFSYNFTMSVEPAHINTLVQLPDLSGTQDMFVRDYLYAGASLYTAVPEVRADRYGFADTNISLADLYRPEMASGDFKDITQLPESEGGLTEKQKTNFGIGASSKLKAVEIPLREGLKWSNGDIITAQSFVDSVEVVLDRRFAHTRAGTLTSGYAGIAGAQQYYNSQGAGGVDYANRTTFNSENVGIFARGTNKLVYVFSSEKTAKHNVYNNLSEISGRVFVHAQKYREWIVDPAATVLVSRYNSAPQYSVSSGVYKWSYLQPNVHWQFTKNEHYFGSKITGSITDKNVNHFPGVNPAMFQATHINVYVEQNPQTLRTMFMEGKTSSWAPSGQDLVNYRTSSQYGVTDSQFSSFYVINSNLDDLNRINTEKYSGNVAQVSGNNATSNNVTILANENFRKALYMSIDRGDYMGMFASKPLLGLISHGSYLDEEFVIRQTPQAMKSIIETYGLYTAGMTESQIEQTYKQLEETGGQLLSTAKTAFSAAHTEAQADPNNPYNPTAEVVIRIAVNNASPWAPSDGFRHRETRLNENIKTATAGTPFENRVRIIYYSVMSPTHAAHPRSVVGAFNGGFTEMALGNAAAWGIHSMWTLSNYTERDIILPPLEEGGREEVVRPTGYQTTIPQGLDVDKKITINANWADPLENAFTTTKPKTNREETLKDWIRLFSDPELPLMDEDGNFILDEDGEYIIDAVEGPFIYDNSHWSLKLIVLLEVEKALLGQWMYIPVNTSVTAGMYTAQYQAPIWIENRHPTAGTDALRYMNFKLNDADWAKFIAQNGGNLETFYRN